MRRVAKIWPLAIFVIGTVSLGAGPEIRTLGDKAPEFSADFIKGEPIGIAQPAGAHVFVIEFWATWCGPCRYSAPRLSALEKRFGDRGLAVIGISNEAPDVVKAFMKSSGDEMKYRVAIDREQATSDRFFAGFGRTESIPTAYVIDGHGRVAWVGNPLNPFLDTLVERLVADLPEIRKEAAAAQPAPAKPE